MNIILGSDFLEGLETGDTIIIKNNEWIYMGKVEELGTNAFGEKEYLCKIELKRD